MPPEMPRTDSYPFNSRYASVLEHNPATNEPFITMPAPFSNLRLTPPRLEDGVHIMAVMNNLDLCMNFASPPFPYLQEHCDTWMDSCLAEYRKSLARITDVDGDVGYLDTFPLGYIREVAPDGSETFAGNFELSRARWDAFGDEKNEEAQAKAEANNRLPPGDSDIVWMIGGECLSDYLLPSYHGRGIMTAVVKTVIELWATPHMNARKFHATSFPHNIASCKVFLKNGFKPTGTIIGAVQFPESKGGKLMDSKRFALEVPESKPV